MPAVHVSPAPQSPSATHSWPSQVSEATQFVRHCVNPLAHSSAHSPPAQARFPGQGVASSHSSGMETQVLSTQKNVGGQSAEAAQPARTQLFSALQICPSGQGRASLHAPMRGKGSRGQPRGLTAVPGGVPGQISMPLGTPSMSSSGRGGSGIPSPAAPPPSSPPAPSPAGLARGPPSLGPFVPSSASSPESVSWSVSSGFFGASGEGPRDFPEMPSSSTPAISGPHPPLQADNVRVRVRRRKRSFAPEKDKK